jgi:hypothetical protein
MNLAQIYCTARELNQDLGLEIVDEALLYEHILEASATIERRMGYFIPVTQTRIFNGTNDGEDLRVDPFLAISAITDDDTALTVTTDYLLKNPGRQWNTLWENGPYTRIQRVDGGWSDDVDVTGKWGLWEETKALGETVSLAAVDTATLVVTDGSKLHLGMVLKCEDEQLLVTGLSTPTLATSLVNMSAGVTLSDDEITVDNGAEFHEGETIRIGTEQMLITLIAGHVLGVKRNWNSTKKATHANDTAIYVYRTYSVDRGVNGTTAAIHASKALYRYMVPRDVRELCKQISALIKRKAETGYAGKSGGGMDGEVYFYNEFPRTQMAEVESHYKVF